MTWLCAWWPPQDPWLALFTLLLVVVGGLQAWTLWATLRSNRTIERAYVALSHTPRGLQLSSPSAQVTVRVKNHGNTPACVTGVFLRLWLGPLPDEPPYEDTAESMTAFLTARDKFYVQRTLTISAGDVDRVRAGMAELHLLGYADYQDRFRGKHRHRYARRYEPSTGDLVFVTRANYNRDEDF